MMFGSDSTLSGKNKKELGKTNKSLVEPDLCYNVDSAIGDSTKSGIKLGSQTLKL